MTEKWTDFEIQVEGAVKTSGNGGFVIGAGYDKQYYWYQINGEGAYMEVTRQQRGSDNLVTKMLGNNYANRHYNKDNFTAIHTNDAMDIFFNYGVKGKLEANYTSNDVSLAETAKYDVSSDLYQYQTDIYQVVNKDDKNVYIKLVNPDRQRKSIQLNFKNLNVSSKAEVTTLTAGLNDANAIGNEIVKPITSSQSIQNNQLTCQLVANSVNVIRVPLSQTSVTPTPKPQPSPQPAKPKSVSLNVKKAITIGQGEKVTLKATVSPKGVSQKVNWSTSKKSVVTVKNGKITGKKPGKSVIMAKTSNGKYKKCAVTVKKKPSKINLNAKKKILKKGKTFRIKVKFPKNTYSYKLTYTSSKNKIASVSKTGVVKAKKKGKAVITVKTYNGKKAKITFTAK